VPLLRHKKHILSKKYSYVIVADRGFGNDRFLRLLEENDFKFLIRATPNMIVIDGDEEAVMSEICSNAKHFKVIIKRWSRNVDVFKCSNGKGDWHLLSNIEGLSSFDAELIYKNRFKIEKCFQDLKSSGFNIEQSKIKKYSKYKKLLAMVMVAHVLLVFLGHVITVKIPAFLKNSALMADVILAYFLLEERLTTYLTQGNSGEQLGI
jgi:transposase